MRDQETRNQEREVLSRRGNSRYKAQRFIKTWLYQDPSNVCRMTRVLGNIHPLHPACCWHLILHQNGNTFSFLLLQVLSILSPLKTYFLHEEALLDCEPKRQAFNSILFCTLPFKDFITNLSFLPNCKVLEERDCDLYLFLNASGHAGKKPGASL